MDENVLNRDNEYLKFLEEGKDVPLAIKKKPDRAVPRGLVLPTVKTSRLQRRAISGGKEDDNKS